MKIKDLIKELKRYGEETEINFVLGSENEDTDYYDLPLIYEGEIDTSMLDDDNPSLTVSFTSPCLEYDYNKTSDKCWTFKNNLDDFKI